MSILTAINPFRWQATAAVVVVLIAAIGAQQVRVSTAKSDTAVCRVDLSNEKTGRVTDRAEAAEAAASQSEANRRESARRNKEQQDAIDDREKKLVQARADIAIRDAAAGRLRQRVEALIAATHRASGNPSASGSSAPADDASGVLADVLGRCVTRVRLLATVADERGIAGAACERIHDSLTAPAP